MPNRKTIDVPCMVKRRLKVPGPTRLLFGKINCMRIIEANEPATTKKSNAEQMYIKPSFLWSTVTTNSWSRAMNGREVSAAGDSAISRVAMLSPLELLQGQQVRDYLIQLGVRQLHVGHIATLFDRLRVPHPGPQFFGCIGHCAGAQRFTTHEMGQVGAKRPHRIRSFDGVTVDAGRGEENIAAGPRLWIVRRRLPLARCPLFEILRWMHDHPEQHVCVLHTAIFGAVANISSRLQGFDPHPILPIGNHIGFACKLRHPEAMRDIRRLELEEGWPSLARLTDRHMHLIRGHDAQLWVANFPPPLVADHRDVERIGRRDSALYIVNRACRREKEHEDGHNWDHCPGEFELVAAVDLRWLPSVVTGPLAKSNDGIGKQTGHHQKNSRTNCQD